MMAQSLPRMEPAKVVQSLFSSPHIYKRQYYMDVVSQRYNEWEHDKHGQEHDCFMD